MIKSESYALTLAFCEVVALEEHLHSMETSLGSFSNGATYSASAYGITINCASKGQADKIFDAVLVATDDEVEESE